MGALDHHGARPGESQQVTIGSPLGDFLRAVYLLGAGNDRATQEALAPMFGLRLAAASADAPKRDETPKKSMSEVQEEPLPRSPKTHDASVTTIPSTIRRFAQPADAAPPQWLSTAPLLPPSSNRVMPAKVSLYEPQWVRAILTTALGVTDDTAELDVTRLIEHMVNQRTVHRLPVRRAPSLARGVYCWIDRSASMQPFVTDQAHLVTELHNAVGTVRLNVLRTTGVPPPLPDLIPGVPHLVLSDLGVRQVPEETAPDPPRLWAEWAATIAREYDSRVIAFVPGPLDPYPPELQRVCAMVCWDRGTSVQNVRRALAGAHA